MTPALWFLVNGTFVCAPPKCGGTALYRAALGIGPDVHDRHVFSSALERTEFFTPDQVECSGLPALLSVRDPVGRFGSLWRDKCRDVDENMSWLAGLTPNELMDFIESDPVGNGHWAPQVAHYREGVEVIDYKRLLSRLGLPRLQANATNTKLTDPAFPIERILQHYRADVQLRFKVNDRA